VKPLIGITTARIKNPSTGWEYNRAYVAIIQSVADAGGLPILIPVSVDDDVLRELYSRVDGVLLPGGGDVDPVYYHADKHPKTGEADDSRDHAEITVAQWAVADDLPVFGICRGHQVLNVALGGTLVQDIPAQIGTDVTHDFPEDRPRGAAAHPVQIDPSSRLASILGTTSPTVNSLHHQSVETAAPGTCVTAYSPDGVVEALEMPDKNFVLSVQWHPEDMYSDSDEMKRLFRAFVEAARERAAAKA
jgi:putative glutamine amidotransferase